MPSPQGDSPASRPLLGGVGPGFAGQMGCSQALARLHSQGLRTSEKGLGLSCNRSSGVFSESVLGPLASRPRAPSPPRGRGVKLVDPGLRLSVARKGKIRDRGWSWTHVRPSSVRSGLRGGRCGRAAFVGVVTAHGGVPARPGAQDTHAQVGLNRPSSNKTFSNAKGFVFAFVFKHSCRAGFYSVRFRCPAERLDIHAACSGAP